MPSWISGKEASVEELIAQKRYDKAIDAIKTQGRRTEPVRGEVTTRMSDGDGRGLRGRSVVLRGRPAADRYARRGASADVARNLTLRTRATARESLDGGARP